MAFQADLAARCGFPVDYHLVNAPGPPLRGLQEFALCRGARQDVDGELEQLHRILKHMALDSSKCPLASIVSTLHKDIAQHAPDLWEAGQHQTLILHTQGLPTDAEGKRSGALKALQRAQAALGKLPIKLVIRLCTDDEDTLDTYNVLDADFGNIDVLDDYWGEALEVHLHNPWLTYARGLHRLRECGLAPDFLDDLDEQALSPDSLHRLCAMIFGGAPALPHPRNWGAFLPALTARLLDAAPMWNPVKKKETPWINLRQLERVYGTKRSGPAPRRTMPSVCAPRPPPGQ